MCLGDIILYPLLANHHIGGLFMSLENKIKKLIDKHQDLADNYHRNAEIFYNKCHFEKAAKADQLAHPHESFATELILVLQDV